MLRNSGFSSLDEVHDLHQIGAKAKNLAWLIRNGMSVPPSYVLPFNYHKAYKADGRESFDPLRDSIKPWIREGRSYAVRSSANVEDGSSHSFAGQFTSFLHLRGLEPILDAIESIYQDVDNPRPKVYMEQRDVDPEAIEMAIIIQEMVEPHISGVSFSKNPLTGHNEIIIEALQGSGEALMQAGETPERWVQKWGDWIERPTASLIDAQLMEDVAADTKKIEERYGCPVDLEWVFDGQRIQWVQVREITGLGDVPIYSNKMSREMLPGLILPLVWSVNIPLVNSAWVRIFTALIGPNDLDPLKLAKAFYFRTYFNMASIGRVFEILGFPPDSLELLIGLEGGEDRPNFRPTMQTLRHIPRMIRFFFKLLRYGRTFDNSLAQIEERLKNLKPRSFLSLREEQLLEHYDELYALNSDIADENIIVPLLLSIYSAILRTQLRRININYTEFDYKRGLPALEQYDPNIYLARLHAQFNQMPVHVQQQVFKSSFDGLADLEGVEAFYSDLCQFRDQFGHLSESGNDFSKVPWHEDPEFILRMIFEYQPPGKTSTGIGWEQVSMGFLQRFLVQPIFRRSRQFLVFREAISSQYTQGIEQFRQVFLELGRRWVERGLIEMPEDIFYLYLKEVRAIVEEGGNASETKGLISERRAAVLAAKDVVLPEIIYGDHPPPMEAPGEHGTKMHGIPSSRGYYQGKVNVINNQSEFGKMQTGDVLVIPFSDVAWVPLFAKAGAVIAESGGMLSHSSIVAREYGLPCIVSVSNACSLKDGTEVRVDGFKGEITLLEVNA